MDKSRADAGMVSIITVCFNSAQTIRTTIESVLAQTYENIEYVIIDGGSTDGTLDIVREYGERIAAVVSEPDRGIYDAMNKGIRLARGDVIGLLNADDFYVSGDVVAELMDRMQRAGADCVFADVEYVDRNDVDRVVRYYDSSHWTVRKLRWGWIPAHPTFFIKKSWYERCGNYSLEYRIAADFEWLVRIMHQGRPVYSYLKRPVVRMRVGGVSTASWRHRWLLNREIVHACRRHGIWTAMPLVLLKIPRKLGELAPVRRRLVRIGRAWRRLTRV